MMKEAGEVYVGLDGGEFFKVFDACSSEYRCLASVKSVAERFVQPRPRVTDSDD